MIPALNELPAAPRRMICHWTGGAHRANAVDLAAYHYVVEEDGTVRAGVPVEQNMRRIDGGPYAAHTRGLNSYSVGIALAGMRGSVEPDRFGPDPITERQMDAALRFVADCCREWRVDPVRTELLTHAEVPAAYGIAQPGKWDIAVLPWDDSIVGAAQVGAWIRGKVCDILLPEPDVRVVDSTAGLRLRRDGE